MTEQVAHNVAEVMSGKKDRNGDLIEEVYQRKDREYAVYRTRQRVLVHFADDGDQAVLQRRALAPLLPLRDDIDGLIQGWRDADPNDPRARGFFGLRDPADLNSKARCQDRRVGGALAQAFEDDVPGAQSLLEKIKNDILNERVATARFEYLLTALASSMVVMFLSWLLASLLPRTGAPTATIDLTRMWETGAILLFLATVAAVGLGTASWSTARLRTGLVFGTIGIMIFAMLIWPGASVARVDSRFTVGVDMWRGVAAGTVGAFFSIALAIRGRTVLPDLLRTANMLDAVMRVTVGAIGAAVLIALVSGEIVTLSLVDASNPLFALIAGFFAGFAERLVPDLLAKASEKPTEIAPQAAAVRAQRQAKLEQQMKAAREPGTPVDAAAAAGAVNDNVADDDVEVGPEGFQLEDDDVTYDNELPAASGGVANS